MTHLLAGLTLSLLFVAPAGCVEDRIEPIDGTPTEPAPAAVPPDAIRTQQGAVAPIGQCQVGVVSVAADHAILFTSKEGAPDSRQKVRKGQLLVACGALHRLVGLEAGPGSGPVGNTGNAVLIDRKPAAGVSLKPGSLVLTIEGTLTAIGAAKLGLRELAIALEGGRPRARLKVTQPGAPDKAAEVGTGDLLEIGPARHKVLDVKSADAATGVPGWIEIEGTATPG
jgi:hypothetical protein